MIKHIDRRYMEKVDRMWDHSKQFEVFLAFENGDVKKMDMKVPNPSEGKNNA